MDFAEHRVRMVFIKGEPWWVAADVCRVLGLDNASLVVKGQERKRRDGSRYRSGGLDSDEGGIHSVNTPSGDQQMLCVNESGLYVLIFESQRDEAKAFRKWVTSEVLPEIRRTGTYSGQCCQAADRDLTPTAAL